MFFSYFGLLICKVCGPPAPHPLFCCPVVKAHVVLFLYLFSSLLTLLSVTLVKKNLSSSHMIVGPHVIACRHRKHPAAQYKFIIMEVVFFS